MRRVPASVLAMALFVALAGAGALRSTAARRHGEWERARETTERDLAGAVRADAPRWARDAFAEADTARRAAVLEQRRQQASLWPLPDYTQAHEHLRRSSDAARHAAWLADALKADARAVAEDAIDAATRGLDRSSPLIAATRSGVVRHASRARLLVDQAERFFRDGEYDLALARASAALRLARDVSADAAVIAARYRDETRLTMWRRWSDRTVAWSRRTNRAAIVVSKVEHRLTMYVGGRAVAGYDVDLSDNWIVDKAHAGDGAIPEGRYHVTAKKNRGESLYYKALLLSYPDDEDRRAFAAARRDGRLAASARIGGLIEVHGDGGRGLDWTRGCVALANGDLDRLFARVEVGTPVTIVGASRPHTMDELLQAIAGGSPEDPQ